MQRLWMFLGVLAFAGAGCGPSKGSEEFLVEGTIAGYGDKVLVLDRMDGVVPVAVDSVVTDGDGGFAFVGKAKANQLYQLRTRDRKTLFVFPGNSELHVEAVHGELPAYRVTGNAESAGICHFTGVQYPLYRANLERRQALVLVNREKDPARWRRVEAGADTTLMAYHAFLRTYMDTVGLPVLRAFAGVSLNPSEDYHLLGKVVARVEGELPGHPLVVELRRRLDAEKSKFFAIEPPDWFANKVDGDSVNLFSFRGKPVLLYVWASYCEYSRRENRKIREVMQGIVAQSPGRATTALDPPGVALSPDEVASWPGVHFVTYAIDENPAEWRAAVAADSMDWGTNVLSPTGWSGAPVSDLGIKTIPFMYLLDARGILRSKGLKAEDVEGDLGEIVKVYGSGNR